MARRCVPRCRGIVGPTGPWHKGVRETGWQGSVRTGRTELQFREERRRPALEVVRVAEGVDAFLAPVEAIVAESAADVRNAIDDARGAADMAKPGPYAAGAGAEEPGTGGDE
jgi:hypothetical protein